MQTYKGKLHTFKSRGVVYLVLGIYERERLNSFSLDCLGPDGERHDFTCGKKGLDALPEVEVAFTASVG